MRDTQPHGEQMMTLKSIGSVVYVVSGRYAYLSWWFPMLFWNFFGGVYY